MAAMDNESPFGKKNEIKPKGRKGYYHRIYHIVFVVNVLCSMFKLFSISFKISL